MQEAPYELVKPKNAYKPNDAPFDGTTTHRAAFVPMETPAVVRVGARSNNIGTQQHPFEGTSVYKDSFTKMPASKRDKIAPKHTSLQSGPFDGEDRETGCCGRAAGGSSPGCGHQSTARAAGATLLQAPPPTARTLCKRRSRPSSCGGVTTSASRAWTACPA